MEQIWNNIVSQFEAYGPKVFGAAVIMIGFLLAAYVVKWLIAAAINRTGLAKSANASAPSGAKSIGASLASAAFWVIVLIGLVQALNRLELTTVVDPLNDMISTMLNYVPNIVAAVVIFGIFYIVARVVRQTISAVLTFADPAPEKLGFADGPVNISGVTATVASSILLVVGGIAAFDALNIASISEPAIGLLESIVDMIPNIIVAGLILAIFVIIGRFVSSLARKTLPSTGVDAAIAELGVLKGADKGLTATSVIANLAMFFITLLGLIAALRALNLDTLTNAMDVILGMAASITFGAVIIFAGVFIARLITGAMASSSSGASDVAANAVKWIIIILACILGISRMGLDPTGGLFVLDAARILLIGGAAGLALAFGLGGKEWAAGQLAKWRAND